MKNLFKTLILAVGIFSLMFSSCKKETLPSMSASFDGTLKNFVYRSTIQGDVPVVGQGFLIIGTTGTDLKDGEYFAMLIRGTDVKTYNLTTALSDGKFECEAIYRPKGEGDTTNVFVGKSGTISITQVDENKKRISGTFSFTMVNKALESETISVTNGKFENLIYLVFDGSIVSNDFDL